MKRKLDFSTLVLIVDIAPMRFVSLMNELNELRRQVKTDGRVKIVSQHKVWPAVVSTWLQPRKDNVMQISLDYDNWFLWASTLEGEGYGRSVIVVPSQAVEAYDVHHNVPKNCTISSHVTISCIEADEEFSAVKGFVIGWLSAPRARYEPLELKTDSSFGASAVRLLFVSSYEGQAEGEPLMNQPRNDDACSPTQTNPSVIECVAIDGKPIASRENRGSI